MKLSFKIFFSICIPSIIAIVAISAILIVSSFKNNIDSETNRCVQELSLIEMNIENSFNNSTSYDDIVVKAYADYYMNKGINLYYFEDGIEKKLNENLPEINGAGLINVDDNNFLSTIQKNKENYYILVSTKLNNNQVLIYTRNINRVYQIRSNLMKLSIALIASIVVIIAIIAYMISKSLTKPLVNMQREMVNVSKGNYDINLKEGKNEIGMLAKSFNRMSKELEHRNNELIEMINSKQVFIDNLSHEINTPLTSILGYAELLEKANCSEEQKINFLANIQKEAKRINDIHKKLLLLSYKKNSDLEKNNIPANAIFEEVNRSVNVKIKEHNIHLRIENSLSSIYGDETLVIMCITNLISNAVHASKDGSKIEVKAFKQGNKDCVQVIDEGQGISKENIAKITEPFYRVDKARSRKNGGAGLGLSICTAIMELHNGSMKIQSELGKGSCFTLEFPQE